MKSFIAGLCLVAMPLCAFAEMPLRSLMGVKFPNSAEEGDTPVVTTAWAPAGDVSQYPGYSELIPYVLRSPHQEEAGSCLYMSLTGVAEFFLARLNPNASRAPEGPLDLSERYLMNVAGVEESQNGVANWKTDSVFLLNNAGRLALNSDYRFTKGWVTTDAAGEYVKAAPQSKNAWYDTRYNWINEMNRATQFVSLPKFQRDVLFADPASDQWNVAVMPADIIERIKTALRTRQAPVHIIYNHYGYWHAVYIIGYDDEADSKNCGFTTKFMSHMEQKVIDLRAQAESAKDQAERDRLNRAADKAERISNKVNAAWKTGGGCSPKGMFYVRDSIYTDQGGPVYDYDLSITGDEYPYSKTIVMHEYDWIRYMANHATQIYLQ